MGTATTSATGSVSISTPPLKLTEQVQLVHPKTATTHATTSTVSTIKVAYAVTAGLSKDTVTVTVAPSAAGRTVQLQKLGKAGWATVQTGKLGAGSSATFTIKPPKGKGSYRYRVVKAASSGFLRGINADPSCLTQASWRSASAADSCPDAWPTLDELRGLDLSGGYSRTNPNP